MQTRLLVSHHQPHAPLLDKMMGQLVLRLLHHEELH